MSTYIITGGAGFIGSHVCDQLLLEGHRVIVLDDLSGGSLGNLPGHENLIMIGKNVMECVPEDFPEKIDGIAHLAAKPSVVDSWKYPLPVHQANLTSTVAVIELCRNLSVPRLIFASSASVYGNQDRVPVDEVIPPRPDSPYGIQKYASEHYLRLFSRQYEISSVSLRFFNVFGPRQVPDSAYSGVISIMLDALGNGNPITIYGDGKQTRDFIYVKDVARAVCMALQATLDDMQHQILNIGTGKECSINQLLGMLQVYFPLQHSKVLHAAPRPGDIRRSGANIAKAANTLGFRTHWDMKSALQHWLGE